MATCNFKLGPWLADGQEEGRLISISSSAGGVAGTVLTNNRVGFSGRVA
jgi:hypothetical protein